MSNFSEDGHYVLCPLCEGKGRMHRSELAAKLADHEVEARLTVCRQQLVQAEAGAGDFKREVLKGPVTRILWRRSPKE